MPDPAENPPQLLQDRAPWLLAPELATCVVGSAALAEACRRAGVAGPAVADLDLSWALSVEAGEQLLQEHGVALPITAANRERGTLAAKLDGTRVEITTFRGTAEGTAEQRIADDLRGRDMTVGALAWWLEPDRIVDPLDGLEHWHTQQIVPCGDPAVRVREHPVRWLRYYRRAHQWGFELHRSIRRLDADPQLLSDQAPAEAIAAELRAALLTCASPGRLLVELHEVGLLAAIAPELAPQFDGRPAGPVRHHPEVSQSLHMVLALEWIVAHTADLPAEDRLCAAVAVLCHDLGKGLTPPERWPAHHGHEASGVPLITDMLKRLPGLADGSARRMAKAVSRLHLEVRRFDTLRDGTKVDLYERYFRSPDLRADLFALAVGADVGGRLDRAAEGNQVKAQVEADVAWLRERCASVDAAALRTEFGDDTDGFRAALHQRRCEALRQSPSPEHS